MDKQEMRQTLEHLILYAQGLLDSLLSGAIPTDDELRAARYEISSLDEKIKAIRQQLADYQVRRDELDADLQRTKAEATAAEQELAERKEALLRLQDRLASLEEEILACEEAARRHRTGDDKPAVLPADHSPDEPVPPAPREDDPALISALELQTDLGLGQR